MVGLRKHWNKFLNWLIPNRRRNIIIKMMRDDEELGLYDLSKEDFEFMVKTIKSNPKPNKELKKAAQKYKNHNSPT